MQVNVVIECYDMFKNRFPFSKPVAENPNYSGNAWDALYNAKKGTGSSGANFGGNNNWNNPSPPPNSGWGNPNAGWANQPSSGWNTNNNSNWGANNNNWGGNNNAGWGGNANSNWGNQPVNSQWGNQPASNNWGGNNPNSGWGNAVGGMGGIMGSSNATANIASAQKLVGKQKQTLQQINGQYIKLIEKVQVLDATKQAL